VIRIDVSRLADAHSLFSDPTRNGGGLLLNTTDPISPAAQLPYTIENRPASPPACASRMRSGAANFATGMSGSLTNFSSMPSGEPPAPPVAVPTPVCVRMMPSPARG